jgi:perosamine synthetase
MSPLQVPFFRPSLGQAEHDGVHRVLDSGWLTTGSEVARFESEFVAATRAEHAIALNSATAALHLAVEALGLRPGQGVLVPTLTFAATAEVVRYMNAVPILVDCDPRTLEIDLRDAEAKLQAATHGTLLNSQGPIEVVGMIPVHVGGVMADVAAIGSFAGRHDLWVVEDAAHAFPAAWRRSGSHPWIQCGQDTANVTCFSFYANKTITTGEGGMAVTSDSRIADRMRLMALHGLSKDAWGRYSGSGTWDYRIVAPGFKYNLTDLAAAIGRAQLARAEELRSARERLALRYLELLDQEFVQPPANPEDRIHAWHLMAIRLRLEQLEIDRAQFIEELKQLGVATSVHWRPLHRHPYYEETFGWEPQLLPTATAEWLRLVSLPLYPSMTDEEQDYVVDAVQNVCATHRKKVWAFA